jgi:hypothetical protein
MARIAASLPRLATVVVVAIVATHGVTFALDQGASDLWRGEQRYVEVGRWISTHLPERAVLVSMQHSGAARYYSGRITVRYDRIPRTDLDLVLAQLDRLGYHPYFVLDASEEPAFRERFQADSAWGRLDWTPLALVHAKEVRVYDANDRRSGQADRQRVPEVVR